MSKISRPGGEEQALSLRLVKSNYRRTFLVRTGWATVGFLAFGGVGVAGERAPGVFGRIVQGDGQKVDLGSGDTGIMNYAYALEQLEAAFYTRVMKTPYPGMSADERQVLTDIRDHEIVHREFFKRALGSQAIPALEPDFGKIKFDDRKSVLNTAKTFEALGVSAYNGAGQLIKDPNVLLVAGKIVSVEARHTAAIHDLLEPRSESFADTPLDGEKDPDFVLKAAGLFIKTKISADNLPKKAETKGR